MPPDTDATAPTGTGQRHSDGSSIDGRNRSRSLTFGGLPLPLSFNPAPEEVPLASRRRASSLLSRLSAESGESRASWDSGGSGGSAGGLLARVARLPGAISARLNDALHPRLRPSQETLGQGAFGASHNALASAISERSRPLDSLREHSARDWDEEGNVWQGHSVWQEGADWREDGEGAGEGGAARPSSSGAAGNADGGPRSQRPLLRAVLQVTAIFGASVFALSMLLTFMLPPLTPSDHAAVYRFPGSVADLKETYTVLQGYSLAHYFRVQTCYVSVFLFLQAYCIPGSMYMSVLGGALYGIAVALPLVCFCVSVGALVSYWLSALLFPPLLANSVWLRGQMDRWAGILRRQPQNLLHYMVLMRLSPIPPHWVVNVFSPHLNVPAFTFWLSTLLGTVGIAYIHTEVGTTLDSMTGSDDFELLTWTNALKLLGIGLAVLAPIMARRYFYKQMAGEGEGDESAQELVETLGDIGSDLSDSDESESSLSRAGTDSSNGDVGRVRR